MNKIGLSTSAMYPYGVDATFRAAKELGYDGVEIMISQASNSRSVLELERMSNKYDLPILSVHAPTLLLTHFVWGRDPEVKLFRSAVFARELGAETVVVHPPCIWQRTYTHGFVDSVREFSDRTGVKIAVENMFGRKVRGREYKAYAPDWGTLAEDCDHITFDFSHAALAGVNGLQLVKSLEDKLTHIHLCDGMTSGSGHLKDKIFDEHLVPGKGDQPVADVLKHLKNDEWNGTVVAEVNTRSHRSYEKKLVPLQETLQFARAHLG